MDKLAFALAFLVLASVVAPAYADGAKSPLEYQMKSIDGTPVDLSQYKGQVVLIVNTASKCGLTPQYKGLEALYEKYKDQGLTVLGFPANEFGAQEPGTNQQIATFCKTKYNVSFPMFSKIVVKGDGINPLYETLTSTHTEPTPEGPISWNFEKFLIGRDGNVVARFAPRTKPDAPEVVSKIEAELAKKG